MRAVAIALITAGPMLALPTMIRLGYTNCAACHLAPQGGGLLNGYGRSIDEAQSLRGGEYQPTTNPVVRALSWGGRITQDLRFAGQEQVSTSTNQPIAGVLRSRFMYRNATEFGKGVRFSAVIVGENESAARPKLSYNPRSCRRRSMSRARCFRTGRRITSSYPPGAISSPVE